MKLDLETIVPFERNNERVLPIISSRLKFQGRFRRIYQNDAFLKTIEYLKSDTFNKVESESKGVFYLKKEIMPFLQSVTGVIQSTHPTGSLEKLIADVFRSVPNVIDVDENGRYKGYGSDFGADLIIKYKSGLPVANLAREEKLVVQVKSFIDKHWDTTAVTQIKTAIDKFKADSGLIITTAEKTEVLEAAIEELSNEIEKPIALIAGEDVARFVLTYGSKLLM